MFKQYQLNEISGHYFNESISIKDNTGGIVLISIKTLVLLSFLIQSDAL